MTELVTGITGAKRQSQKKANPYSLLRRIMDENPDATELTLRDKMVERVFTDITLEEHPMIEAMFEYWFANCYRNLTRYDEVTIPDTRQRQQETQLKTEQRAILAETVKARARDMVLMDLVLPTGKTLYESSGRECAKAGGWFTKIAAKIKPTEIVGKKLSEEDVRKLLR